MNNNTKQKIGKYGEQLAKRYLTQKGYKIIETNFYSRFGEIDIIARSSNNEIVFVEVKTWVNTKKDSPERAIHYLKLQKMWKTIQIYLSKKYNSCPIFRIDTMTFSIDTEKKRCFVRHIQGVLQS